MPPFLMQCCKLLYPCHWPCTQVSTSSAKKVASPEIQTWLDTIHLQLELIDFLDYQISAVSANVSLSVSQGPPIPHREQFPLTLFGSGQARAALACTVSLTLAANCCPVTASHLLSNAYYRAYQDMQLIVVRETTHASKASSGLLILSHCIVLNNIHIFLEVDFLV